MKKNYVFLLFLFFLIWDSLLDALDSVLKVHIPQLLPLIQWLSSVSLIIFTTVVFVLIFRVLPDVKINWRYLWIGAITTSSLFFIGRRLIGLYLRHSDWVSIYGAAASLVVLLLWIYYSALIFFFGAELTQVIRQHYCREPLKVSPNAVPITKTSKMLKTKAPKK